MKGSYVVACGLILFTVPDLALGQEPSQPLRARPEHLRMGREFMPDAGSLLFRLTPANSVYLPSDGSPAWLTFHAPILVGDPALLEHPEGIVSFSGSSGQVTIHLGPMVPGRRYHLTMSIYAFEPTVLSLHGFYCAINFSGGAPAKAYFNVPVGENLLEAVIERSFFNVCAFTLARSGPTSSWRFYYAELREIKL